MKNKSLFEKITALMAVAQPNVDVPLSILGKVNRGGIGYNQWWKFCMTNRKKVRTKKGGKGR